MRISPRMFTDTITIITPGTRSSRVGDDLPDWDDTTTDEVRGRLVQRTATESRTAGRDEARDDWSLYLPADVTVTRRCRVECAGRTYEVTGEPYVPVAVGGGGHQELTVRHVEG